MSDHDYTEVIIGTTSQQLLTDEDIGVIVRMLLKKRGKPVLIIVKDEDDPRPWVCDNENNYNRLSQ